MLPVELKISWLTSQVGYVLYSCVQTALQPDSFVSIQEMKTVFCVIYTHITLLYYYIYDHLSVFFSGQPG